MSQTLVSPSGGNKLLRNWKSFTAEALSVALVGTDAGTIIAMSVLSGVAYHGAVYGEVGSILSFLRVGALTAAIVLVSNLFRGEYKLSNFLSFKGHMRRTLQLWNVTFVFLLLLGFLSKVSIAYSRGWLLLFYLGGICALFLLRYGAVQLVRHSTVAGLISTKRIFLVGAANEIERFIDRYDPCKLGIEIVGCRFLSAAALRGPKETRQSALRRDLGAAIPSARHLEPDAIFIMVPWSDRAAIDGCVEAMLTVPCEIHIGPDYALQHYSNAHLSRLGPMASLQLVRLPLSRLELVQKRVFDLVAATLGTIAIVPALALIAVLIKLDSPGPVFFRQQRYGFNQQPFRILKFRTMTSFDDGPVVPQATRNDPRITRVGRWLRRWNLDELPQLLNVIMGDMSLVGPRPHALSHNREFEQFIASYARRHNVRPGITGWAQIHGLRGETDTTEKIERRVEYDLYYIENWSLGRDFMILLRTFLSPLAYRNAY